MDWIPKRLQKKSKDDAEWDAWERVQSTMSGVDYDRARELLDGIESDEFRAGPLEGLEGNIKSLKELKKMIDEALSESESALSEVRRVVDG